MIEYTETQQKIIEITAAMRELLLYKNQKYGDSALSPIFLILHNSIGINQ